MHPAGRVEGKAAVTAFGAPFVCRAVRAVANVCFFGGPFVAKAACLPFRARTAVGWPGTGHRTPSQPTGLAGRTKQQTGGPGGAALDAVDAVDAVEKL